VSTTTTPDLPFGLSQAAYQGLVADAADRAGVSESQVEVVSIEAREFNDASLGCPEEGVFYAQVITPGFRVVVSAAGEAYDYRIGQDSLQFRHCEEGGEAP
jgi:hypothetical protein